MQAILLIGEDDFLLKTRAAVLRVTGAEIVRSDVISALHVLDSRLFDIVVLCHSIAGHICETLSGIIQQNWPGTRILHISAIRECEEAEGAYTCSYEPEVLIARTIELLGRRPVKSVSSQPSLAAIRLN